MTEMSLRDVLYLIRDAMAHAGWTPVIAAGVTWLAWFLVNAAILRYRRAQQIKLTRERLAHASGPATWYEREL